MLPDRISAAAGLGKRHDAADAANSVVCNRVTGSAVEIDDAAGIALVAGAERQRADVAAGRTLEEDGRAIGRAVGKPRAAENTAARLCRVTTDRQGPTGCDEDCPTHGGAAAACLIAAGAAAKAAAGAQNLVSATATAAAEAARASKAAAAAAKAALACSVRESDLWGAGTAAPAELTTKTCRAKVG